MASPLRLSPLLLGIVLLAGFLGYVNWPQEQTEAKRGPSKTPVVVAAVEQQMFPITIEALGTARANESVTLTAREADLVTAVNFDDGDVVNKGDLLVQLRNLEEKARLNELKVSLQEAQRQLVRVRNLAKESAASEQLLDEQQTRVETLKAQIEVAQSVLTELEIRAPFSGKLGIREISVGSLVRPADVITTLDDLSVIKVDFSVAESHLASLANGQKITATSVAYPGEAFIGEISGIDSRVDPVTRSILVRAEINNREQQLRPGMLLQITLEKTVLDTLVVQEKALVPVEDRQYVFVVENGTVRQQEVLIGARRPGRVQVLEGVNAGDFVVVEGTLRIRDQSQVRIINNIEG